jgi:hypothetical protein
MSGTDAKKLIARLLRQSLEGGSKVEIDGLGTFVPGASKSFRFIPQTKPRVFIAYVDEDLEQAIRLSDRLVEAGFDPWLDKRKLLPGQNWPRAIETAILSSEFVVACFSHRSASKRGCFQCELRYAMQCAARIPLDEIFLIPVRLDPCVVPVRITRQIHYVDLYPSWEAGFEKILKTMADQEEHRRRKQMPPAV